MDGKRTSQSLSKWVGKFPAANNEIASLDPTCEHDSTNREAPFKLTEADKPPNSSYSTAGSINVRCRDITSLLTYEEGALVCARSCSSAGGQYTACSQVNGILDACAALAVKTTHLLELFNNSWRFLPLEKEPERLDRLAENPIV